MRLRRKPIERYVDVDASEALEALYLFARDECRIGTYADRIASRPKSSAELEDIGMHERLTPCECDLRNIQLPKRRNASAGEVS